jgi:hypothetical protein
VEAEQERLRAELGKQRETSEARVKKWMQLENRLRRNWASRVEKEDARAEIIGRIIEFSQAKSAALDEKE